MARIRLRKTIELNDDVRQILKDRGKRTDIDIKTDLTTRLVIKSPVPAPPPPPGVTPMSGDDKTFVSVWGLATDNRPAEEVRRELVDKSVLITNIVLDEKTAVTQPSEDDIDYGADIPSQIGFTPAELEGISVDMKLSTVDFRSGQNWNNWVHRATSFGTATDAMRAINAPWVARNDVPTPAEFTGADVNVVIVDEGMNKEYLEKVHPGIDFGGGFVDRVPTRPDPGTFSDGDGAIHSWHAHMIVRNVLRLAPKARIFDAPLLPARFTNVDAFTDDLQLLYEGIETYRNDTPEYRDQPWVLVNAWAVADSIQEYDARITADRRYTIGQNHHTNVLINDMAQRFDIVFAAGNNGEFQPTPAAGLYNTGETRSISGANAISSVLTVGAANVNGQWIGASSHGDGPDTLKYGLPDLKKPDVAAPSWFREDNDCHQLSTGSSAACGVAAGLVAALRTEMRSETPQEVFDLIRSTAFSPTDDAHSPRMGCGLIRFPDPGYATKVA